MKILICCTLILVLSGCIPIGISGSTRAINANDRAATPGGDSTSSRALY